MPETDELYNQILHLKRQVENIDAKLAASLASDPRVIERAISLFAKRKDTLIPLYLEVDGVRNVTEIAHDLKKDKGNVSRDLKKIHDWGYIDKIDEAKGGAVYKKNQFEKILHLSEQLKAIKEK